MEYCAEQLLMITIILPHNILVQKAPSPLKQVPILQPSAQGMDSPSLYTFPSYSQDLAIMEDFRIWYKKIE